MTKKMYEESGVMLSFDETQQLLFVMHNKKGSCIPHKAMMECVSVSSEEEKERNVQHSFRTTLREIRC